MVQDHKLEIEEFEAEEVEVDSRAASILLLQGLASPDAAGYVTPTHWSTLSILC